jgi:hypothetical protein
MFRPMTLSDEKNRNLHKLWFFSGDICHSIRNKSLPAFTCGLQTSLYRGLNFFSFPAVFPSSHKQSLP